MKVGDLVRCAVLGEFNEECADIGIIIHAVDTYKPAAHRIVTVYVNCKEECFFQHELEVLALA